MTEPTLSGRLKTFRTMVLANVFPPEVVHASAQLCGLCGGPAGLRTGRLTEREFIVPHGCGHHPHAVGEEPRPFAASDGSRAKFDALVTDVIAARNRRADSKRTF